jgi:tripartite-type tricarboxylate transporter receptor subunit TctC
MFSRKCVVLLIAMFLAGPLVAQTFPERPVRIIVPYPAGGSNDIVARILGQKLSEEWGHQVIIDNRGGAGETSARTQSRKRPLTATPYC